MLDSIKLGIPLTQRQHERILHLAEQNDCWQWVLLNPSSGELLFRRTRGIADTDGESFHRQLRWDIPHDYNESECRLTLEFSVPKYWYGHNIHLLYDIATPLDHLRDLLNQQFGFKGRGKLIDTGYWHVSRADFCYSWRFPSQRLAKRFLDSLKRLHYPRKKPIIYDDSIVFSGKTYSVKIYLKLPEFKAHDRREMLKGNASLEWVNHLESLAYGVIRFEVTCRRQFLKKQNIEFASDLVRPIHRIQWIEGTEPPNDTAKMFALCLAATLHRNPGQLHPDSREWLNDLKAILNNLDFNPKQKMLFQVPHLDFRSFEDERDYEYFRDWLGVDTIEPAAFTFRERDNPTAIAQYLLTKFVGENAGMQRADEVESKLMETYKPVKAARLVSFWLYVQKFGSAKAKEIFGKNSYYVAKADMKKAGVTLIEPPSGDNITVLDRDFIQQFKMEIPSQFVTNKVDDFRDSGNVLNFVPKVSDPDAS